MPCLPELDDTPRKITLGAHDAGRTGHHSCMSDHVMVFAPTPHLTVTVEGTSGGPEVHLHPGAQGIWQARMVRALGGTGDGLLRPGLRGRT